MNELIDKQAITLLVSQLGLPMVNEVVAAFIPDAKDNIKFLQQHWHSDKYTDLRIKSHSLKSSAANIGLQQLSNVAKELETFCITPERHSFNQELDGIEELSKLLESSINELALMGIT